MDLVPILPGFIVAVFVISATPGPAFALIVQRTAVGGRGYALVNIAGIELGLYAWALLVASGLAVVAASEIGFVVLKVVGCAVLGWLAFKSFRSWWAQRRNGRHGIAQPVVPLEPCIRRCYLKAFFEGFVVQMANPKAAVFLLALYPQFVPADHPLFPTTALLGLLQVAVETVIYVVILFSVHRARAWFSKSVVRRRLEVVTGSVMIALGVRLAASQR